MPLIALRVVCGIGDTMLTSSWQAVFKKVDFPADGLPTIVTIAVRNSCVPSIYTNIQEVSHMVNDWYISIGQAFRMLSAANIF